MADESAIRVRSPGRANLMGDHTDYNEGFVLPVALEQHISLEGVPADGYVELTSPQGETDLVHVELDDATGPTEGWGRYVTAVIQQLSAMDLSLRGFEGRVVSSLPVGAGLSSSASLEVGVALALLDEPVDPEIVAHACHQAENLRVGVPCGVMDQMTVALARAGHALFIDCRTDRYEQVAMPPELAVVVVDSGTSRELQTSGYGERVAQCREAARILDVESLRDVDFELLSARKSELGDVLFRRARHVVTENDRVLATKSVLGQGPPAALGELFDLSHISLANDFEVTTPEIDELQTITFGTRGVYGARLTGGGFGGCIVAVTDASLADEIATEITDRFARTHKRVRYWTSAPADGAKRLPQNSVA